MQVRIPFSIWLILLISNVFGQPFTFQQNAQRSPANPESYLQRYDNSVNNIHFAHRKFPAISGRGKAVSIKERRFDTLDADLFNRYFFTAYNPNTQDGHATEMATLIAGSGNTGYNGMGVAWQALITPASFENLLPEPEPYYRDYNITVQNHSYGTGIENVYADDAAAYDLSMWRDTGLLHVFSAGNRGTSTPGNGRYAGIPGFSNLTGSFKMSKNSISVGATDSFYRIETLSSRGPAYEGRLKPELVAFGVDGSSGAAALVSGTSLLLQQTLQGQTGNQPSAALVKSLLLTGARQTGNAGPDYVYGYGHLDAFQSMDIAGKRQFRSGNATQGISQVFTIEVPENTGLLKITLCWTDTAAKPGTAKALVNDLDLVVTDPVGNHVLPWILSVNPHADSLRKAAYRGRDTMNTTEQVTIEHPGQGNYTITVNALTLQTGRQPWSVSWSIQPKDTFYFTHPVISTPMESGKPGVVRWNHSFSAGNTGMLEYRFTGNQNWIAADDMVELTPGYKLLTLPDTNALMQFRMTIGNHIFLSDTFFSAKPPEFNVGYACPDSVLLEWKPMAGIRQFKIYVPGDTLLQPAGTTSGTFFKIPVSLLARDLVTVSALSQEDPLFEFRAPSKAISFQGVGCYFKNFLAQWDNGQALLSFSLGTTYNIGSAFIQKQNAGIFETIHAINPVNKTEHSYTDGILIPGANTYRVVLNLLDGRTVISPLQTLIQPNTNGWWVYPNPVKRNGRLNIINRWNETENLLIDIYDAMGRKSSVKIADLIDNSFVITNLAPGMYFLVFHDGKNRLGTDKLVVIP